MVRQKLIVSWIDKQNIDCLSVLEKSKEWNKNSPVIFLVHLILFKILRRFYNQGPRKYQQGLN